MYASTGKIILLIIYIVFILFTVFRVIDVGIGGLDAYAYKQYFLGSDGSWSMALEFQKYEIGYATIIWIFRKITADYRVVLLLYIQLFLLSW